MKPASVLLFLLFLPCHLAAQRAPEAIADAHGLNALQAGSAVVVRGTASRGERSSPFTLHLRAGDSRLEIGEQVVIHAEGLRQEILGGEPGRVEYPYPGLHDSFLMPFWNVRRLGQDFAAQGREAGRDRFQGQKSRRRFLSAPPENHEILLEFDETSGLLAQAAVVSPQDQPDVSYHYSDYRRVQGLQVPHRVERRMAGRTVLVLEAEQVELNAQTDASVFRIIHPVPSR